MLKKLENYLEVEKWLNILIKERISRDISVNLNKDENKWIIKSKRCKKFITIVINEYFYLIGYQPDLLCTNINLENNFFDSIYKELPAPRYNSASNLNIFKKR